MTTTTKDDVIQQRSKRGNENKAKAALNEMIMKLKQ
jgi:hypothetical protein